MKKRKKIGSLERWIEEKLTMQNNWDFRMTHNLFFVCILCKYHDFTFSGYTPLFLKLGNRAALSQTNNILWFSLINCLFFPTMPTYLPLSICSFQVAVCNNWLPQIFDQYPCFPSQVIGCWGDGKWGACLASLCSYFWPVGSTLED